MSQRLERVAGEVRAIVGEVLARDEIKDPRVRGAGLITVTHVRVSGDLRHAWALFTVHDADAAALERVRQGLNNASGYFRQAIARRLRMKVAPAVKFEVDHVFEQAERVEKLLREDSAAHAERGRRAEPRREPTTSMMTAATNSAGDAAEPPTTRCWSSTSRSGRRRSTWSARCGAPRGLRRVGHGGTLDPAASGVLPICLGEATKLAQFLLDADKEYDVHGLLRRRDRHRRRGRRGHRAPRRGRASTRRPSRRALAPFRGAITQVPPDLLGAQAGGAPALRLRARRRDGRDRAAQRGRARAGADVVRGPGGGRRSRCAARRGRTCGRWRAISGGRWAWART